MKNGKNKKNEKNEKSVESVQCVQKVCMCSRREEGMDTVRKAEACFVNLEEESHHLYLSLFLSFFLFLFLSFFPSLFLSE